MNKMSLDLLKQAEKEINGKLIKKKPNLEELFWADKIKQSDPHIKNVSVKIEYDYED